MDKKSLAKIYPLTVSLIPFAAILIIYFSFSNERHRNHPQDKLLPTISEIYGGFKETALKQDRNGDLRLELDTIASLKRIAISIIFIASGIILGLLMGSIRFFEILFYNFILFLDKIPALALLPVLFLATGIGEVTKISLIVIGVAPTIILDTYLRAKAIPEEQIIKALTLNASKMEIMFKITLPRIIPNVLDTLRLNFKSVILFLIAGESLCASVGLGFRIFLVTRYMAMDIIIPYVLWIGLLTFLLDYGVRFWISFNYPWLNKD